MSKPRISHQSSQKQFPLTIIKLTNEKNIIIEDIMICRLGK
jgi:hypothetical protein